MTHARQQGVHFGQQCQGNLDAREGPDGADARPFTVLLMEGTLHSVLSHNLSSPKICPFRNLSSLALCPPHSPGPQAPWLPPVLQQVEATSTNLIRTKAKPQYLRSPAAAFLRSGACHLHSPSCIHHAACKTLMPSFAKKTPRLIMLHTRLLEPKF